MLRKNGFWDQSCPLDRFKIFLEELTIDYESFKNRHYLSVFLHACKAEYHKLKLLLMKLAMGTGTGRTQILYSSRFRGIAML